MKSRHKEAPQQTTPVLFNGWYYHFS